MTGFETVSKEQFTEIVKRAFHEFVNGRVDERLQSALKRTEATAGAREEPGESDEEEAGESKAVTTDEEIEGFYIVRAILAAAIDVRRVFIRDTRNYCGILLDDTNRKPICRLWFNAPQKYIGVFDSTKAETKHAIDDTSGIYRFAEQLKQTVLRYEGKAPAEPASESD